MNYKSAFLLRCPAIPKVRIALVGLGNRGTKTLVRYAFIGNAEISCIVDVDSRRLERANKLLRESGRKEALALCGPDAWKEACQLPDIDLIYMYGVAHPYTDGCTRYALRQACGCRGAGCHYGGRVLASGAYG